MQSVNVYLRDGKLFVSVTQGSQGGDPCIDAGPVTVIDATADEATIGSTILSHLQLSRSDLPWPTDWKKVTEPLFNAAGVKSWGTFAKRTSNARVDRVGDSIVVRGARRDEKNAFSDDASKRRELIGADPQELGRVIIEVLR